jgi:hypothetical protein
MFNMDVLGRLSAASLEVTGNAHFGNETVFDKLVTFLSNIIFRGKVSFEKPLVLSQDSAGFAIIRKDEDRIDVTFANEFEETPIVNVSMSFDKPVVTPGAGEDPHALEKRIFNASLAYMILNRSTHGFTIVLNKNAGEDITFSWVAVAVKDPKVTKSVTQATPTPGATAQPSPSVMAGNAGEATLLSPTPSPTVTVTPTVAPTATLTPTIEPTISVSTGSGGTN